MALFEDTVPVVVSIVDCLISIYLKNNSFCCLNMLAWPKIWPVWVRG